MLAPCPRADCPRFATGPCLKRRCPGEITETPAPQVHTPDTAGGSEGHPPAGTRGGGTTGRELTPRMDGNGTPPNIVDNGTDGPDVRDGFAGFHELPSTLSMKAQST